MARPRKQLEDMEFDGWDQLDALIVWASEEYCAEKLGTKQQDFARLVLIINQLTNEILND